MGMTVLALQEDSHIAWAQFRTDYLKKNGVEATEELRPFVLCGFWLGVQAAIKNKPLIEATADLR